MSFEPADSKYVSLRTVRRSGVVVPTAVWIAQSNDAYYVFSEARAGKVKRIRNNSSVSLRQCDMRGREHGATISGRAELVDDPEVLARAYAALLKKYGWSMRIADFFATLSGRIKKRAMIEIRLTDD